MIPFFVAALLYDGGANQNMRYVAAALFIIASLTDMLDGKIARKYNLVTNFGKFMDPLADKLLVCSALICMIELRELPAWMVIIIISREFIISGFRLVASDNGVVIAICGGYQLLGKYYKTEQGMITGLDLVDMYTEQEEGRLISNIVLQSDLFDMPVVGFENHGGRTCINNNKPLGKVLYGSGNDGKSGYEGVVYKNVIGTYLHGPLLPKNPQLADWLIEHALKKKYGEETVLTPLDDSQEKEANDYIVHRFVHENK